MLLGILLDKLFNYEMFMELLEVIWDILSLILFVGGAAYGISYWIDISGDARSYRETSQDSLKKIKELEHSEKFYRKAHLDSLKKINELESAVKKLTPNPYKAPLFIETYSSNDRTVFVVDLVVTFESLIIPEVVECQAIQKDAFIVYLNGIVAKKDTIDSITCDGSNVIITFNSNLNFSLDSVDEFMITGPLLVPF